MYQVANLYADHPDTCVEFLGGRYNGKEGVQRLYIGRFANSFVAGRNGPVYGLPLDHPQMQGIVDVNSEGTRAKGRFRSMMSAGTHDSIKDTHPRGLVQWWEGGVYENEYIKENGVWKIFRLKYFPFWHATFEKHQAQLRAVPLEDVSRRSKWARCVVRSPDALARHARRALPLQAPCHW